MPPNYKQCIPTSLRIVDEKLNTLHNDQRKSFTNHCRIFYQHSLSLSALDNGNDEDINTSREIMNFFNCLISSQQQQQPFLIDDVENDYSEILKCGLHNINDKCVVELTKIRNEERRKAHELGMKQRCQEFHMILDQIPLPHEHNKGSTVNHVKDFVSAYKKNIGIHSVFAGMSNLLEAQLKNDKKTIFWNFDSATITESFDNSDDSKEYFEKVATMFLSFLVRVEDEEEDNGVNGNVLCWQVEPSLTRKKMRIFLNCLPLKRDLHAKPTGELIQTETIRNSDKDCWCFW